MTINKGEKMSSYELNLSMDELKKRTHKDYLITKNFSERTELIKFLKEREISAVFHYIPLHSAPAGIKFGRFDGKDEVTTEYSERLVRLPFYYGLSESDQNKVIEAVLDFYSKS